MSATPQLHPNLQAELIARAGRERDFFNRKNHKVAISDEFLKIPADLHEIPPEVAEHMPSLVDKDVCEVGCGYGVISCYFAERGARVLGFDVADTNIEIAKRAAQTNGVMQRARFQVMQAESMTVPANSFDLIYGNAVLHHLDIITSAREFLRVLKSGGVAIFREPLGENRMLEWARRSPLRSAASRHTVDECSLRYHDLESLRTVFPDVQLRESELLGVFRAVFRKCEVGMITIPRWQRLMDRVGQFDAWLLSRCKVIRPLASYCVVTMIKPKS